MIINDEETLIKGLFLLTQQKTAMFLSYSWSEYCFYVTRYYGDRRDGDYMEQKFPINAETIIQNLLGREIGREDLDKIEQNAELFLSDDFTRFLAQIKNRREESNAPRSI